MDDETDRTGTEQARRTDHLKPYQWQPGESGNPKGRPRGIPDLARAIAKQLETEDADGRPQIERIAEKLIELVMEGDGVAVRELLRRLWPVKAAEMVAIQVNQAAAPESRIHEYNDEDVRAATDVIFEILGRTPGSSGGQS